MALPILSCIYWFQKCFRQSWVYIYMEYPVRQGQGGNYKHWSHKIYIEGPVVVSFIKENAATKFRFIPAQQKCILSSLIFNLMLDAMTIKATKKNEVLTGYLLQSKLENLNHADDVCLMAHLHKNMQNKFNDVTYC